MSFTTTTASAAIGASDLQVSVTSATGFLANDLIRVDDEIMAVTSAYATGTIIPVRRGQNGTVAVAHPSGVNVTVGLPSDFQAPNATVTTAYPLSGLRSKVQSYSASGAIALPVGVEEVIAVLNGTSVLTMTVAVPTKDQDGAKLYIASNGVAASTVQFTGGLSGASTSYDVITINASAPILIGPVMAINGLWQLAVAVPLAGTVTNITGTVA